MVEHHLVGLAPDARLLVAAERRVRRDRRGSNWSTRARPGCRADAIRAVDVAGPHAGAEAVERVVGDLERFGVSLNVVTETTGPNISSWKTRILLWPSNIGRLDVVAALEIAGELVGACRRSAPCAPSFLPMSM